MTAPTALCPCRSSPTSVLLCMSVCIWCSVIFSSVLVKGARITNMSERRRKRMSGNLCRRVLRDMVYYV